MAAMFVIMVICGKTYGMSAPKIAIAAVLLTVYGYLGAKLMFLIESGEWAGGRSLFGSIFLVPVLMVPTAKLLKLRYADLMDICAPAECIMLALLKVKCSIDGCCGGRVVSLGGRSFVFPSQRVECIAFILIMFMLLWMLFRKNCQGLIYPYYMIIYGIARFILNSLRDTVPWIGPLPAGNFWSLVCLALGIIALVLIKRRMSGRPQKA